MIRFIRFIWWWRYLCDGWLAAPPHTHQEDLGVVARHHAALLLLRGSLGPTGTPCGSGDRGRGARGGAVGGADFAGIGGAERRLWQYRNYLRGVYGIHIAFTDIMPAYPYLPVKKVTYIANNNLLQVMWYHLCVVCSRQKRSYNRCVMYCIRYYNVNCQV